jgi:sugar lactone lactonase YvrE
MPRSGPGVPIALALAALALPAPALAASAPVVIASGLDSPRGLAFGPGGSLYMAIAGRGGPTSAIDRVLPDGTIRTVLGGLPSFHTSESLGPEDVAFGPHGAIYTTIPPVDGGATASTAVRRLAGRVIRVDRGRAEPLGSIAAVESRHDADGTGKDSDPFGIAVVGSTRYVADAGANALLREHAGRAALVSVFPKISPDVQSVPTAIRRGPDGALYVGELTGSGPVGSARIWRIVPGHRPRVFARGLSNVIGLAFGPDRSLYVAELSSSSFSAFRTDGVIVRIRRGGRRTTIGAGQLPFPGGVAVARDGTVFVTIQSVYARQGELVSIAP